MKNEEQKEYITVLEKLLEEREKVLNKIPPCPVHGGGCVPHALEWIERHLTPREPVVFHNLMPPEA